PCRPENALDLDLAWSATTPNAEYTGLAGCRGRLEGAPVSHELRHLAGDEAQLLIFIYRLEQFSARFAIGSRIGEVFKADRKRGQIFRLLHTVFFSGQIGWLTAVFFHALQGALGLPGFHLRISSAAGAIQTDA